MSAEEIDDFRRRARAERARAEITNPVHKRAVLELAACMDRVADAYERLLRSQ